MVVGSCIPIFKVVSYSLPTKWNPLPSVKDRKNPRFPTLNFKVVYALSVGVYPRENEFGDKRTASLPVTLNPIKPSAPVGPVIPIANPGGPVGPVLPCGPVFPVYPVSPLPVGPVDPEGPVLPVIPVGPIGPCGPIPPVGPAQFTFFKAAKYWLADNAILINYFHNFKWLITMSHQPVTYQQLLAQQYEENARDLLVYQEMDYQNVQEDVGVDAHNAHHDVGEKLVDPHEFQQFAGNRNTDKLVIKPSEFKDKGKSSVRYNKDVQIDIFNIDTRFRAYAVPGITSPTSTLIGTLKQGDPLAGKNYINTNTNTTLTSLTSNFVFNIERIIRNIISATLTSFELPNRFFNLVDVRNNYYIYVKQGVYSDDNPYTKIAVYITDYNLSSSTLTQTLGPAGQNGFYYSNTSIIPALNYALKTAGFTELSVTYVDGYCYFNNSSTINTYVLNFTPEQPPSGSIINTQIYPTLGRMLGFTNFIYEITPINPAIANPCTSPCDTNCGHLIICKNNGNVPGEDHIDMNADSYIYLSVADWNNVQHETADNSFFTVFAKIPITVEKGKLIYDITYNNSTTKTYYFLQPTNLQEFPIKLLDKTGQVLLMPNVDWSMTLELEEVLSQSLYEKMREL